MTVIKSRGATKKLGPISTGSKIVQFRIPSLDRRFAVHEGTQTLSSKSQYPHSLTITPRLLDLICRTSSFFKSQVQNKRKPVSPTDKCCFCLEALDPITSDISFCVQCGQNVHEVCMEDWRRSYYLDPNKEAPLTYLMCRASWTNDQLLSYLAVEKELDAEAVHIYLDWPYTSTLHIRSTLSRDTDAFNLVILKLWAVASAVEDTTFKAIVITTFFEQSRSVFTTESVKWAFVERKCDDEIRDFVLTVALTYLYPGWFRIWGDLWPDEYVRELADMAMTTWKERKSIGDLSKMWAEKLGTESDDDEEEGLVAKSKGQTSTDVASGL
ncbi:hypothetical protein PtrSN002B_006840 [Pyrenophora tritici-repentis]|uniref:Uncharacterized protein n=2 Tax=Pyrenophora tritici-repentis TaxID=45151 RepID=A0A2W1EUB6_9PLEO|nr:uncharacterized protein PTRG_06342 [Pyrenophora tritici-repentis Pt-1C-BFP]KAA8613404.1 hypothetical protein PtrV1_12312 [Pyrenophora tritici-repentis]EDU49262.1 conserved hypothetical protein [Pyrenophora tritici-repentis Pt-1C-BFP]KAF7445114.1 hypothetical protein A1F99_101000 [Pyrenophora tritici-repentis]KAF7565382.1 hypothetical protein PtrM4_048160 [Pyrenophora tritici-repentis]KAG9380480.1 hypothetical protein A1F94_009375 [Pyrenophora tritici-repentis]